MSLARQIVPGRVYLITRRCSERRFLMRPDAETTNAFIYCLAVSADRFDIGVVALGTMSNHHHLVAVDRAGRLPQFLQYFHRLFAAHQNALRGRWEAFWAAGEQTSVVELIEPEDILVKSAYAICNPVKDHVVDQLRHWPGPDALRAIEQNSPLSADRPGTFFRSRGPLPPRATLSFVKPPGFEHLSHPQYAAELRDRVTAFEHRARTERIARGIRVLGRKLVLRQHWNDRPRSREPRRQLNPRLACKSIWSRLEALERNKEWLARYADARVRWQAGQPGVIFPTGVWWLARHADVRCEPHQPPD